MIPPPQRRNTASGPRAGCPCGISCGASGGAICFSPAAGASSGRSILYYLFILRLAQLLGKKTFIYSQGIGPINSSRNRRLTARVLRRASGIVVRDEASRDLLLSIGVPGRLVQVTADPVIRVRKADTALGLEILEREGCPRNPDKLTVGWALKST